MPKTNHQRNFVDERDYSIDNQVRGNWERGAMGNDFTNGKHGAAKNRKGRKKFVNSRTRFRQNQELKLTGEVSKVYI